MDNKPDMDNRVGARANKTRTGVNNTPDNRDLAKANLTRVRTGETRVTIVIHMKEDPGVAVIVRNLMNLTEEIQAIHQENMANNGVNRVVARKGHLDNNLASQNMRPNQKPVMKQKAPGEWKLTAQKEEKKTQKNQ